MKKIVFRALKGFPIGIAIGHVISIANSILINNGSFYPCPPALIESMGSEILAVILQTLLYGILGAVFAASSVIWEIEEWSIVKQTFTKFLITSTVMMPIAYINHWMHHSIIGFLSFMLIFTIIFFLIWTVKFFQLKRKISDINNKLKN